MCSSDKQKLIHSLNKCFICEKKTNPSQLNLALLLPLSITSHTVAKLKFIFLPDSLDSTSKELIITAQNIMKPLRGFGTFSSVLLTLVM